MFAGLTLKKRITYNFAVILVIAVLLITTATLSLSKLTNVMGWNAHTYEVIGQGQAMLVNMVNIETGTRGFVASGVEKFLDPVSKGKAAFADALAKAKQLTSDNPAQQERLSRIEGQHRAFVAVADSLTQMRRDVNAGKIKADVLEAEFAAGHDKVAMGSFRSEVADFLDAEGQLLVRRRADAVDTASLSRNVLIFGGLFLCIVVLTAGFWLARSVLKLLGGEPSYALEVVQRMTKGDLSQQITLESDDHSSLLASMAEMQKSLAQTVSIVRQNAESVSSASGQIADGNSDLSSRTSEQASALEETAASMEQLASTVHQNSDNAKHANQLAHGASDTASKGGEVVAQVVDTMNEINESSNKIVAIISVIDEIAFQTNLLALNAAVEAARAGEQGRGFAVVATEVRNLAQRSATAAKEIKGLITDSVARVEQGTTLVDQAKSTMSEVVTAIKRVTDVMVEISAASAEQNTGVAQIGQAVQQIDETTQQNAALVEQSAAAAENLRYQANQLVEAVSVFKIDDTNQDLSTTKALATTPVRAAASVRRSAPHIKSIARPQAVVTTASKKTGTDDWASF